jgi:phage major head subunit gpT-like protein
MTVKSFEDIVADFNLSAKTEFNKQYEMLEPELQNFALKYNAGNVSNSKFFINMLFGDVKEWKGTQEYEKVDKVIQQQIDHTEYFVEGVEIFQRDFKRAQAANSITGLDMYTKMIGDRAMRAKDAPYEIMLDLLEAGDASTYGTCFDGQNLFDTTHAFNSTAGSQSNLLTGTGVSTAQLSDDLKSAISALKGFYYETDTGNGANKKKRYLNKSGMKLVVVCDATLYAKFNDLRTIENIVIDTNGGTQSNSLRNTFEVVTRPFTDLNDWYLMEVSNPTAKPFLISMEDEGTLKTPADNPEALTNLQVFRYAYNGLSFGVAYGAWWKAVQVTNS